MSDDPYISLSAAAIFLTLHHRWDQIVPMLRAIDTGKIRWMEQDGLLVVNHADVRHWRETEINTFKPIKP